MKDKEIQAVRHAAMRARIKKRVTVPNAATFLLGFDSEYIPGVVSDEEIRENEPLSYQLHDGQHGHFIPLTGKLKLSDLTAALLEIREAREPQSNHVALCAWFAQAELSILENDLDAVVLHQGGGNYGLRWTLHFSKRRKVTFTIYDLQALLGGSLAKAAPLVGMQKLDWDHETTTRASLKDAKFREYAVNDAEICVRLAHEIHREFSLSWGMNPFEMQSRGQLASSMFRHHYLTDELMQPHPNVRELALRGYRGSGDYGGCWARGVLTAPEGKVWAEFDAVGAYPAACESLDILPTRRDWRNWRAEDHGEAFPATGLYRAQVTWPEGEVRRTLLAIVPDGKGGEKFDYPRQAVDVWSGFELQAARELGAHVRIVAGWYYETGLDALPVFQGHMRRKRAKAAAEGKDAVAAMYKGLGNTLIGKLGQHRPQIGYALAWDEDRGAADFTSAAKQYSSLGSVYAPEWWCLIVGKARAAMMHAIAEREAVHAQVDAVLILVDEGLEEFEAGGLTFRRKASGRVLRLVQRNTWAFENGEVVTRFAAGGGRDRPELRAAVAAWDGSETTRTPWNDRRLITLPEHATHPEALPLMAQYATAHTFILPGLAAPVTSGGRAEHGV